MINWWMKLKTVTAPAAFVRKKFVSKLLLPCTFAYLRVFLYIHWPKTHFCNVNTFRSC